MNYEGHIVWPVNGVDRMRGRRPYSGKLPVMPHLPRYLHHIIEVIAKARTTQGHAIPAVERLERFPNIMFPELLPENKAVGAELERLRTVFWGEFSRDLRASYESYNGLPGTRSYPRPWPHPDPSRLRYGVQIYAEKDCTGKAAYLDAGPWDVDEIRFHIGTDTVSSLAVTKGWTVALYPKADYQGEPVTISPARGSGSEGYNLTNAAGSFVVAYFDAGGPFPHDPPDQAPAQAAGAYLKLTTGPFA
ncbi:hypothetical protein ACFVVP_26455 [Streptomyces sp. NPDC058128]|uniref:hypothetical protein n=1 Tax=Streptomyces sp. NPDC058128 TaxID=3346352 RepID=UPI0036F0070C